MINVFYTERRILSKWQIVLRLNLAVRLVALLTAKLHYTDTSYEQHQRTPPTDKNLPHPNFLTCRDVGFWHCDVANLL